MRDREVFRDNKVKTDYIKLAYHEGLVPAETWLRVQYRKSHQSKFPTNGKAMNSWLVGMVKCACCGNAMHFNHCANRKGVAYELEKAADVNGDGTINAKDANVVLRYAAAVGTGSKAKLKDFI